VKKQEIKLLIVSACRRLSVFPSYHVLKYDFPVGWLFSLFPSSQKLQFVICYSDHFSYESFNAPSLKAALISNIVRERYESLAYNRGSQKNINLFNSEF